jgi:uncharacterized protein (DUF433 family)
MNYRNYIESDYRIMLGKPVIKGTRLSVEMILRKLGEGASTMDLLSMYPQLTSEALRAAMLYAAEMIANEESLESAS